MGLEESRNTFENFTLGADLSPFLRIQRGSPPLVSAGIGSTPGNVMKPQNFFSSAAMVLLSVTAMSAAHARGGWDGNGLSVSGMAQDTQTVRVAPVAGKAAAGRGAQLRYVELPTATVSSNRLLAK